jgi:peptidoglycan hydrolase CwlO-like protein
MRKKLLISLIGIAVSSNFAFAGICTVKPEADSKKDTLPVKYKKLKAENEALKEKLQNCCEKKAELRDEIESLNSQINSLIQEKESLSQKLSTYPSKEEILSKIQQLQEQLRR